MIKTNFSFNHLSKLVPSAFDWDIPVLITIWYTQDGHIPFQLENKCMIEKNQ